MPHTRSLRAIGETIEELGLDAFEIEQDGQNYRLRSAALSDRSISIGRKKNALRSSELESSTLDIARLKKKDGSLEYRPVHISRLDSQSRHKRRQHFSEQNARAHQTAQLLRTLGRHLDGVEARGLRLSWSAQVVTVEYRRGDGQQMKERFSIDKLREQTFRSRLRRAPRR
jgi:hypothetical protein